MNDNICKFIPNHNTENNINAINFVYEKNVKNYNKLTVISAFIIYVVTKGNGSVTTLNKVFDIKKGDIFFTFPAIPFSITNSNELQYMYITFLGLRANSIFKRLNITHALPVCSGYDKIIDFWENAILSSNINNVDLIAESVLLYTFATMSTKVEENEKESKSIDIILKIKKYIDDNYHNINLSLTGVCHEFAYNSKYISSLFKEKVGVGFTEYVQTIRVQHACELINQGVTTVKDISYLCGYEDSLYFSKVFKKAMGVCPKDHIRSVTNFYSNTKK